MENKIRILKLLTWYKGVKEEQAKLKVFKARMELNRFLQEKQRLLKEKKETYKELKEKKVISSQELRDYILRMEKLLGDQDVLERKIKQKEEELNRLYKLLEEAYKERKLMENLKDRTIKEWLFEKNRLFYREMDELAILRQGLKNEKGF